MHPTTSYQIATLQAAELERRAGLRHTHTAARRSSRRTISSAVRSSPMQAWTVLTALRGA